MDLLQTFLAQMSALPTVWMPFLIALVIAIIVIWKAVQWQHSVPLTHKDSEIAALKSALELNREAVVIASHAESVAEAVETAKPEEDAPRLPAETLGPEKPDRLAVVDFEAIRLAYIEGDLRAQAAMDEHIGKWTSYVGRVASPMYISGTVLAILTNDETDTYTRPYILATFRESETQAMDIRADSTIGVIGRIRGIDGSAISLADCELDPLYQ